MRLPPRLALAAALPLALAACGTPEKIDPPLNPNPTEAYVFEVWTEGAPRPIQSATIEISYTFINPSCLPETWPEGVPAFGWEQRVPAQVEKTPEGRFRATVYADRFQDVNLYGREVCKSYPMARVVLDDGIERHDVNRSIVPGRDAGGHRPAQIAEFEAVLVSPPETSDTPVRDVILSNRIVQSGEIGEPIPPRDFVGQFPKPNYFWVVHRSYRAE